MGKTVKKINFDYTGAWVALLSAMLILIAELYGQYQIDTNLKPQLEAIRAQYIFSQQFYDRQLDSFEDAMTIVREFENAAQRIKLDSQSSDLLESLIDWKKWQDERHLYISPHLQDLAQELTKKGTAIISSSDDEFDAMLNSLPEDVMRLKNRLRIEARDPNTHLKPGDIQ